MTDVRSTTRMPEKGRAMGNGAKGFAGAFNGSGTAYTLRHQFTSSTRDGRTKPVTHTTREPTDRAMNDRIAAIERCIAKDPAKRGIARLVEWGPLEKAPQRLTGP